MRLIRTWAVILVVALLPALQACDGGGEQSTPTTTTERPSTTTAEPPRTETGAAEKSVLIYLIRGERLGVARRTVSNTRAVGAAALRELLAGPTPQEARAGLESHVPQGTELRGLDVAGGTATVDLTEEFVSGGGSLAIQARVAQVVYTLTQFSSVRRVRFAVQGEPVEVIGGEGLVVDPPVGRSDFEEVMPRILVESPAPGERVTSPLRLRGTANTFEATFQIEVLGAGGIVLASTFATATSGTGTRGTFDVRVPYRGGPGEGTLRVFEFSAKDGSVINLVEIPVQLG